MKWAPAGDCFVTVAGFIPSKVTVFSDKCKIIADLGQGGFNLAQWNPHVCPLPFKWNAKIDNQETLKLESSVELQTANNCDSFSPPLNTSYIFSVVLGLTTPFLELLCVFSGACDVRGQSKSCRRLFYLLHLKDRAVSGRGCGFWT